MARASGLLQPWGTLWIIGAIVAILSACAVQGQSSTSATPATIPLVLRTPYFNAWLQTLPNRGGADLGGVQLWNAQRVGWVGFIRVDGELYGWLGVGGDNRTTVVRTSVTPTQTILELRTGPVDLTITFLSPVETSDWALQSLPFSYVAFDVAARDGAAHSVQIYSHLTGEWISSDLDTSARSTTTRGNTAVYHTTMRSNPSSWTEEDDIAQDATLVFAAPNSNIVTTQTGHSAGLRGEFDRTGRLSNAVDSADTPISPAYPAVALALDLGDIVNTASPTQAVLALGIVRDPSIQYRGSESRRPYWTTRWEKLGDAVGAFIGDFPAALARARAFDDKLMAAARSAASAQYADIVAMSVRQLFASIDITTSDGGAVKAFMKDTGIGRRTNPVDTLYASFPALMYFNASLGGILLEPLLELQSSTEYQNNLASPDLGSNYPSASLNTSDTRALSVDSSAGMLIMAWLYTQKSGDGLLVDRYYDVLKKWADYLVDNALRPSSFISSDGLTDANNSNLALKGILGIYAMSQINKALERRGKDSALTQQYQDTARGHYEEWEGLAFSSGRISSNYDDTSSWALAYNLYPARLMGADFVGTNVYNGQTSFYSSRFTSSGSSFGIGYDSHAEYMVKSHWSLFAAASATSDAVRDAFIGAVHSRTFMDGRTPAFSTSWDLRSGGPPPDIPDGKASPAQGAMLSILALGLPDVDIVFSGVGGAGSSKVNAGAIAGGVVGGIAVIGGLALLIYFLRRRRGRKSTPPAEPPSLPTAFTPPPPTTSMTAESRPLFSRLFTRPSRTESSTELVASPFTSSQPPSESARTAEESEFVPAAAFAAHNSSNEKRALRAQHASQPSTSSSTSPISPQQSLNAASSSTTSFRSPSHSTGQSGSGAVLSYASAGSPRSHGQTSPSLSSQSQALSSSSGREGPDRSIVKQRFVASPQGSTGSPASPATPVPGGPPGLPPVEAEDLRAEVLELRRQMAEIQARTLLRDDTSSQYLDRGSANDEPPPSYS